jgi:hypothetical protein
MTTRFQREKAKRRAATVLEVLFATFVIVVGLIGIASIIPVAARNAVESNAHSNALSLGLGWADTFVARGLHQPHPNPSQGHLSWLWYRDYAVNANFPPGWENFVRPGYFNAADRLRVNGSVNPFESFSYSPIDGSSGNPSRRIWGHLAVCIDPYTMTSESFLARVGTNSTKVGSYRAAAFPYFNDRYDPAVDPFGTPTLEIDQPRMLRVGLAAGQSLVPYAQGIPTQRSLVSNLFGSNDDYVVDDSEDLELSAVDRNSRPAARFFSRLLDNSPIRALSDGRYTWMATVVPAEPEPFEVSTPALADQYVRRPSDNCLVSFLILNRHNHEFVRPGADPVLGDVESQPSGERMARVYPLSGNFFRGAGGRVRLIANATVSDQLSVGDWMMLSTYLFSDARGRPYPYFRWYRVIGVNAEAQFATFGDLCPNPDVANDPMGENVWARDVVLEGPDFVFGGVPASATLVSGVVTVIERQVKLQSSL